MASAEQIREVVNSYLQSVATGTADDVLALYADGAVVEDPVGSDPHRGKEAIRGFYAIIEPLEQEAELLTLRIAGNSAAFQFSLVTKAGDQKFTLAPIDVMEFDEDGKITSMKAFWGPDDMVVG